MAPDKDDPVCRLAVQAADKGYGVLVARAPSGEWRITLVVPTEGVHLSDRLATGALLETAAEHALTKLATRPPA
jgi:hypothetical protein